MRDDKTYVIFVEDGDIVEVRSWSMAEGSSIDGMHFSGPITYRKDKGEILPVIRKIHELPITGGGKSAN